MTGEDRHGILDCVKIGIDSSHIVRVRNQSAGYKQGIYKADTPPKPEPGLGTKKDQPSLFAP
jgi:hypothetical protein